MLSVEEMVRLSSFPVDYVLTGTKRDRVKQLGNSVPPLLAAHVIGSVARAL